MTTPVGTLIVRAEPGGWFSVDWSDDRGPLDVHRLKSAKKRPAADSGPNVDALGLIGTWLSGEPADLDAFPTPPGPPFRRACWEACRRIPPGETRTYAELAAAAGSPGAARAAGQSMRHNLLPIAIPCHRVVAASGLGGYAGSDDPGDWRLLRKRWLLRLDRRAVPAD
ncbi:MAG: methylated-DNA--[protein]-cysteine S-methyltransferase [Phycisphaerales bacterium]